MTDPLAAWAVKAHDLLLAYATIIERDEKPSLERDRLLHVLRGFLDTYPDKPYDPATAEIPFG